MLRFLRRLVPLLLLASPVAAQLAPIGAPKGTLRFDIGGMFESADRRLFDGHTEDYLASFGSPALGADRLPFLRAVDSTIGAALGQPGFRVNLGAQQANGQLTIGTGILGAAIGITRKLTLFGRIPLVTTRVQAHLALDSTSGNAGLNPAHPALGNSTDQGLANQFFNDFDSALDGLTARLANGTYNSNPTLKAIAQSVLAEATAMREGLGSITMEGGASAILPTVTSAGGIALVNRIRALQDTFAVTLGVNSSFSADPVLPVDQIGNASFRDLLSNPDGPIGATLFGETKVSRMGDMDVGASYTLIDRFDRPGTTGGVRLALEGLMRLPTGQLPNPNNLLDPGTGNGRYEAGGSGTLDVGAGRWGSRFTGGYLVRFASNRVLRVAPPTAGYGSFGTLTNIRLDAGDVFSLGARPFYRLARNFAIHGIAEYWRERESSASYPRSIDSIPGLPASLITNGSGRRAITVGGGVTYVGRAARECEEGRKCGFPIDASWSFGTVVAGSGGIVPKMRVTQVMIRWYQRIWR